MSRRGGSFDYGGDGFGSRVIVMTLARIGEGVGPDMDRRAAIKRRAPDVMLYAAGGLRGTSNLVRLKQAGTTGVLLASALREGRLNGADLAAAASKGAGDAE